MIQIYVMDISKLKEKEYFERAYALSDLRRQQKADALNTAAGKACCIGAGLLLSFVLKKWGIFLKDEVLEYNEYGKPYLKKYDHVFFNLSHSGCMVACVVGDVPCGVDIQKVQTCNLKLADRFFAHEEAAHLRQVKDQRERDILFTSLFSEKESHAKRDGTSAVLVLGQKADKPYYRKILQIKGDAYVLTVTI